MSQVNYNVGIFGPTFEQYVNQSSQEKVNLNSVDRIEILMGEVEKGLDLAGVVPGLSTISGGFRALYGSVQLVSAIAIKTIGILGEVFSDVKDFGYWEKFIKRADMHIIEGFKNVGRGLSEAIPFVNLFWLWHLCDRNTISTKSNSFNSDVLYNIKIKDPQSNEDKIFKTARCFYEGELKKKIIIEHFDCGVFTGKKI